MDFQLDRHSTGTGLATGPALDRPGRISPKNKMPNDSSSPVIRHQISKYQSSIILVAHTASLSLSSLVMIPYWLLYASTVLPSPAYIAT